MKKLVVGFVMVIVLSLVSGCSFVTSKLFPRDNEKVVQLTAEQKPVKESPEKITAKVTEMVDQMVEKIDAGKWQEAISVGETAYATVRDNEINIRKDKNFNQGFTSLEEKLYETLAEAYDYKNSIDGLDDGEKARFIRTARKHFEINPSDPFKKLALSEVLIETGELKEGFKLAAEIYNSPVKNKDIIENYAWALYLSGRKPEAYNIYKTFYNQSENLVQLYHSAVVIEEYDKLLGLILYKGCEKAGNNLMVLEGNVNNLSAQSSINFTINKSQKAFKRLLVGGFRIDSKYNMESVDNIVKSIVKLNKA